jgi:C4-dicarboxylate transporter DctM subunit
LAFFLLLQFVVMVSLNMLCAMITPPVGLNLFVIQGIAKAKMGEVLAGVWTFLIIMLFCFFLFSIFQGIATWLPDTMIGK